jgi:uncharacterized protein (TIGR02118 family)
MIKMVALVNKKGDMTKEEFEKYWIEVHASLEAKWPGLKKYIISTTTRSLGKKEARYDGMAELWFDDEESLKKALESREREVSKEDFQKFVESAEIFLTKENIIVK